MRLVMIDKMYLKQYSKDNEMLHNAQRPCGLIVQLKYKGRRYDFAVPLRSNIPAAAPKREYFPLPPRPTTRPRNRHGIHYAKMFPIRRSWIHPFHTNNNLYAAMIKAIVDENEKQIIRECQDYLLRYEQGDRPRYSTDLDTLIDIMNK